MENNNEVERAKMWWKHVPNKIELLEKYYPKNDALEDESWEQVFFIYNAEHPESKEPQSEDAEQTYICDNCGVENPEIMQGKQSYTVCCKIENENRSAGKRRLKKGYEYRPIAEQTYSIEEAARLLATGKFQLYRNTSNDKLLREIMGLAFNGMWELRDKDLYFSANIAIKGVYHRWINPEDNPLPIIKLSQIKDSKTIITEKNCMYCTGGEYCPHSSVEAPSESVEGEKTVTDVIKQIPQQPQVQYDLQRQLSELRVAANRLGLYDAADFIK